MFRYNYLYVRLINNVNAKKPGLPVTIICINYWVGLTILCMFNYVCTFIITDTPAL